MKSNKDSSGELRSYVMEYAKRYGPSELASFAASWITTKTVYSMTHNSIYAGLAGTWAANTAYVGTFIAREARNLKRKAKIESRKVQLRDVSSLVRDLGVEFGPSGSIDAFITRPSFLALGVKTLGPNVGPLVGGVLANVIFYGMTITAHSNWKKYNGSKKNGLSNDINQQSTV